MIIGRHAGDRGCGQQCSSSTSISLARRRTSEAAHDDDMLSREDSRPKGSTMISQEHRRFVGTMVTSSAAPQATLGSGALSLFNAIGKFVALLDDVERVVEGASVRSFETNFGPIPWPDPGLVNDRDAYLRDWARSDEGRNALAGVVASKLAQLRRDGIDPTEHWNRFAQRCAADLLVCPSGNHAFGEGPCDHNDGKNWGE